VREPVGGDEDASELRLILARHGQTRANVDHLLDTRLPGPGLTALGREQAAALARELAAGDEGVVDAVYHSRARRAGETARIVAAELGLAPVAVDGVHEVQVGDLEGLGDDRSIAVFRSVFDAWQLGDLDRAHPGGESGRDLLARYLPAVEQLVERHRAGGTVVLVSHGAALRLAAEVLADGVGTPGPEEDHVNNAGRVVLRRRTDAPGPWVLEAWRNDVPGGLPSSRDATG
jgi:broad specificity phosphatase PhoE